MFAFAVKVMPASAPKTARAGAPAATGLSEIAANALFGAALVELIHNYSLIIDDIIDRGDLRRGVPTTRSIYSDAMALLSGMFYRECLSELTEDCQNPHEIRSIMISPGNRSTMRGSIFREPYILRF